MSSSLAVANEALVRIGVPPVSSFDDHEAQGLVLQNIYSQVRRQTLADHPWAFALRESSLPKLVLPPESIRLDDWEYVYQLPGDSVRVLGLRTLLRFGISGDQLYTDDQAARLVYIADVPESQWPPHFRQLVVVDLCLALAIALTDSSSRAQIYQREAARIRPRARAVDSMQTPPQVINLMRVYARRTSNLLATV